MIVEYVPRHATPQAPLSNEARWDAIKELYRSERNREHNKAASAAGDSA